VSRRSWVSKTLQEWGYSYSFAYQVKNFYYADGFSKSVAPKEKPVVTDGSLSAGFCLPMAVVSNFYKNFKNFL